MPRSRLAFLLLAIVPLLCRAASTSQPAGPVFNIVDLGAIGDGTTLATAAFHKAIEAVRSAGGGVVRVPAGKFLTAPLQFVSNMTLQIDSGATIVFTQNPNEYPLVDSRWEGVMTRGHQPCLWARDCHDIAITGAGTIDGQGASWWAAQVRGPTTNPALQSPITDATGADPNNAADANRRRPPLCQIRDCTNVRIDGVTFTNSPFWTLHLLFSDNIDVHGARFVNPPKSPNTDACDIDSCRHVMISDCFADVGDDAFCLKSGRDADGLRVNRPTEDVTVTRCTVAHAHGLVVIGSETSGGVRHVRFTDCTCDGTDNGIRIKSTRGRGGVVEDVVASNITIKNVQTAVLITMRYTRTEPRPVSNATPIFRDIHIDHITATGVKKIGSIEGLEEMPISNITFNDLSVSGSAGIFCSYGKDIRFTNVKITAPGPTLQQDHSDNVVKTGWEDSAG